MERMSDERLNTWDRVHCAENMRKWGVDFLRRTAWEWLQSLRAEREHARGLEERCMYLTAKARMSSGYYAKEDVAIIMDLKDKFEARD